jgi:hypothetical protein
MPAYLFVPKNATPPYQTVVLFPSAYGLAVPSSNTLDLGTFEFIIRSGRALLYPVYKGTFERRFFELLGTPEPHKKYVVLEGGHVPQDIRGLFREVLNWLDTYLGQVK